MVTEYSLVTAQLICRIRLTVRTPGFHPDNSGSIPLCDTNPLMS